MHNDTNAGAVAVAGVEFGWGSSGKLGAVLSALRERAAEPLRYVGLASGLGRPLLAGQPVERWYDLPEGDSASAVARIVRDERVRAALVVLDGRLAKALMACGVPTVFVDSLPFLWSDGDRDELPLDADVYCAQKCVELPPECAGVLAEVRSLRWVDAVISTRGIAERAPSARPFRRALVNLGGLRAPQLPDWTVYPRLVLPAVLAALTAHGVDDVHVAGNLPTRLAGSLLDSCAAPARTTIGPLAHDDFLDQLADRDVLLTSPGLTTLLEAGRLRVPTVCLPPQNLSQIFNGRFHTRALGADVRTVWPKTVFAEDEALALRTQGEGSALDLIYGGTAGAADRHERETSAAVRESVLAALRRCADEAVDWGALTRQVGTDGAAQVADALLALLR
ncbi:hydroxymethylcytosylglucuronate/cytosylglucuronate synthase [Kitasatospora aureofaciens]|uniref:hydroxymethylcytosylglucuronate/cytosylglucurona te synthase n=1 Tax=Kitasatospora aureofaciens TaxID=1894 RepID=UPI001C43E2D5|nr:hydroxymethylcytosylglucuronate/cytosylglucuronate synthase [Kitasatospora aureofaciens]MBV6696613.1 hydroxymethylcytosylglucuronate/cytosylglucuronate synthase [Kitasatospora aureofaciens]